ncbi:hypothetical protein XELAEV_18001728mg [Xenopus laevis]|nr:hypothetical protein XELAEV_18001728mg [Xenopus laevis]
MMDVWLLLAQVQIGGFRQSEGLTAIGTGTNGSNMMGAGTGTWSNMVAAGTGTGGNMNGKVGNGNAGPGGGTLIEALA